MTVLRKSLSYLFVAVAAGAGTYLWQSAVRQVPATAAPVREAASSAKHPRAIPENPVAFELAFVSDAGQPWQVRVAQLREVLNRECGEPEIRYLYHLLEKQPPKGERPEHWYIIVNDVMTHLMAHDTDPRRFSTNFLGLLQNPLQPLVIRDYAVQHLASLLNPRSRNATSVNCGAQSLETTRQILEALVSATIDPEFEQSSIPGTTLMMLVDLARLRGEIDCAPSVAILKPWLARALEDGSPLGTPVRVSVVQAAGILAPQEFRPVLRRIAYAENGQSSLRLPSIAALGNCGEREDLEELQQIMRTNPELTFAAEDACERLNKRLQVKN